MCHIFKVSVKVLNVLCCLYMMLKNLSWLLMFHLYHNVSYEKLLLHSVVIVQSNIVTWWYCSNPYFYRPLLHNWIICITSNVWLAWMKAKHSCHDSTNCLHYLLIPRYQFWNMWGNTASSDSFLFFQSNYINIMSHLKITY